MSVTAQSRRDESQRGLPEDYDPTTLPANIQRAQDLAKAEAKRLHGVPIIVAPEGHILKTVAVYVCPDPDCLDYYGTTGMKALEEQLTGPKYEDRHQQEVSVPRSAGNRTDVPGMRHSRAECPSCRARGQFRERVLVRTFVVVPIESPAPIAA